MSNLECKLSLAENLTYFFSFNLYKQLVQWGPGLCLGVLSTAMIQIIVPSYCAECWLTVKVDSADRQSLHHAEPF